MALVEDPEHLVVDGLEGRDDEQATGLGELGPQIPVTQDQLHLGRAVEGQLRVTGVHRGHHPS